MFVSRPSKISLIHLLDDNYNLRNSLSIILSVCKRNNYHYFRSPNPSTFQPLWPEYTFPNWSYLDLSPGLRGQKLRNQISENCRFWNEIVPEFLPPKYIDNSQTCKST